MRQYADIAALFVNLLPFVVFYGVGTLTRWNHENRSLPSDTRVSLSASLLGEAMPGLFEMVVTLAAVFGIAFQSQSATSQFQLLGLVASAAYLAFRAGFTYSESFLAMRQAPRESGRMQ